MEPQDLINALRDRARKFVSLDTPNDSDLGDLAIDIGAGFLPVIGTAQAGRDFERARREDDKLGMALAGVGMVPVVGGVGRVANKLRKGEQREFLVQVVAGHGHALAHQDFVGRAADAGHVDPLGAGLPGQEHLGHAAHAGDHLDHLANRPKRRHLAKLAEKITALG